MIDIETEQKYIMLGICYDNDINMIYNNTYHSCLLNFSGKKYLLQ